MQQTLFTKPADGYPIKPPPPITSTIHSKPVDPPHIDFLRKDNYLNEFKTEVDKARVRANLGIPDEYSYNWGYISGTIENQSDLMAIINRINGRLDAADSKITNLNGSIMNLNGILGSSNSEELSNAFINLQKEFLDIKINVAQNSTDIAKITTGVDTALVNRVNALESRVDAMSGGSGSYNDYELRQKIAQLELQVNTLANQVSYLNSQIGANQLTSIYTSPTSINAVVGDDPVKIKVYGTYSKSEDELLTGGYELRVSPANVARYGVNGLEFVSVGTATITISYPGLDDVTIPVTVRSASQPVPTSVQYIGYASSYTDLENNNYAVATVAGTWNESNLYNGLGTSSSKYRLWCATTETIDKIIQGGQFELTPELQTTAIFNNTTYNVYRIATASDTSGEFNITVR